MVKKKPRTPYRMAPRPFDEAIRLQPNANSRLTTTPTRPDR